MNQSHGSSRAASLPVTSPRSRGVISVARQGAPLPGRLRHTRPVWPRMPYYLVSGGYTEILEKVRLLSRPGDEFVQAGRVESRVRARQGPQGAPACGLALDAEP